MFICILALIILIGGIVVSCFFSKRPIKALIRVVTLILFLVILFTSCVTVIPTGYTGILTTFGKVEDTTLASGINFKLPWQNIITMDNREQRQSFSFDAFSSDIQQTAVSGSINFNIDKTTAMNLYKEVGSNYANVLIAPRLYENTKVVFSHYTAEGLVSNREVLANEILGLMKTSLSDYGINVISVSIEDIDFTDAFTNSIEAKQVATQEKLRAQTVQEQAVMEAEAQAKQRTIAAEADAKVAQLSADAEAYSIAAKAEAEAAANEKINKSLTPELIEYVQAQNWDGKLPTTYIGNSEALPVISIQEDEE